MVKANDLNQEISNYSISVPIPLNHLYFFGKLKITSIYEYGWSTQKLYKSVNYLLLSVDEHSSLILLISLLLDVEKHIKCVNWFLHIGWILFKY